jgi:hypothetical protein
VCHQLETPQAGAELSQTKGTIMKDMDTDQSSFLVNQGISPNPSKVQRYRSFDVEQARASWTNIHQLLEAIRMRNTDAALAPFSPDCVFENPLIGQVSKAEFAKAIRTLFSQRSVFDLVSQINSANTEKVEVEWIFTHHFQPTDRSVRLQGHTDYLLSSNRIIRQIDFFDRRSWSRQALGLKGLTLSFIPGWRLFLEHELRRTLDI